jgi:hypothetical protein
LQKLVSGIRKWFGFAASTRALLRIAWIRNRSLVTGALLENEASETPAGRKNEAMGISNQVHLPEVRATLIFLNSNPFLPNQDQLLGMVYGE